MDKYIQYDHLQLSEDPSFIRWAKRSEARDNNDWDGWLVNHPEKANDVANAKTLVLAMKFVKDNPSAEVEDKVWNKISSDINGEQSTTREINPRRTTMIKMLSYGAVAAVALILLLMNIGNDFDTSVQTPFAKVENITLPDGSEVMINADSKLKYDTESWNENRLVSLEGEAFFSVKKGSKFTVKTNNGSVQVLGTSFNVYDRGGQFNVHCETGKVSVKSGSNESILTPNQSVSVVNTEHKFSNNVSETENRSTWKKGIFVYKGAVIIDIVAELERQFDIKISMDKSLMDVKYTGSFNKSKLETALTEVFYPLGLKFDINGKSIIITK